MSAQIKDNDPGQVWRNQPEEELPVNLQQIVERRTEELSSSTRSEIVMSIAAAAVLIGVAAWRLQVLHEGLLEMGIAAAVLWVAISLFAFRRRIWRRDLSRRDALAASGLEFYRTELDQRRAHLKNEWLWHGPLALALIVFVAVWTGRGNVAFRPLESVLPLIVLLAAWTGFGVWRRRVQAKDLKREIDDIASLARGE